MAVYSSLNVPLPILVQSDTQLYWTNIFWSDTAIEYSLRPVVYGSITLDYSIIKEAYNSVGTLFNISERLFGDVLAIKYDLAINKYYGDINLPAPIIVSKDIGVTFNINVRVSADISLPYNLATKVGQDLSMLYELKAYTPVSRDTRLIYTLFEPAAEFILYEGDAP